MTYFLKWTQLLIYAYKIPVSNGSFPYRQTGLLMAYIFIITRLMNKTTQSLFFALMQLGIGTRKSIRLEIPLTEDTWKAVMRMGTEAGGERYRNGRYPETPCRIPASYLHQAERDTATAADRATEPTAERGSGTSKQIPASGRLCLYDTERTGHRPLLPLSAAPNAGGHRRMAGRGTGRTPKLLSENFANKQSSVPYSFIIAERDKRRIAFSTFTHVQSIY